MINNYESEARARWGNTDAYREHEKKQSHFCGIVDGIWRNSCIMCSFLGEWYKNSYRVWRSFSLEHLLAVSA